MENASLQNSPFFLHAAETRINTGFTAAFIFLET